MEKKKKNCSPKNKEKIIKCDVESCAFNDNDKLECELNELEISHDDNCCDADEVAEKEETLCNSYEAVETDDDEDVEIENEE